MTVSFDSISSTDLVPGAQLELDGSRALNGDTLEPHRVLIIGTRRSTGTADEGEIVPITGEKDGDGYFAANSMLAAMCYDFKRINKSAECYAMAMDEASGGTAATCTFTIVGAASADGTLRVRIGDTRVSIAVTSGDAIGTQATALAAAINAEERLIFSAAASLGVVTLTCRHKGEAGNAVTLEVESSATGSTVTAAQPSNGATNPTASTAVAYLPDQPYDTIVLGYTDATTVAAFEAEALRRWGPTVKKPCHVIAAVRGSHGTLTTYGSARNSRCSTIVGTGLAPTEPWKVAAQVAARDAQRCDTQPNRPRNGMTLPYMEAPKAADQFDHSERNLLLYDGISTLKFDQSGAAMIELLVTTYQTNANSLADATYRTLGDVRNLAALYKSLLQLAGKYGDYLTAASSEGVDAGVPLLTPAAWRGELKAWAKQKIAAGLITDADDFADKLIAELNANDGERMDTQLGPKLVRGLRMMAIKMGFQL